MKATSALDTITQSEILGPFARPQPRTWQGVLYISHDLLLGRDSLPSHRHSELRRIVECGPPSQIFVPPSMLTRRN